VCVNCPLSFGLSQFQFSDSLSEHSERQPASPTTLDVVLWQHCRRQAAVRLAQVQLSEQSLCRGDFRALSSSQLAQQAVDVLPQSALNAAKSLQIVKRHSSPLRAIADGIIELGTDHLDQRQDAVTPLNAGNAEYATSDLLGNSFRSTWIDSPAGVGYWNGRSQLSHNA
jgi:hypothetical protein